MSFIVQEKNIYKYDPFNNDLSVMVSGYPGAQTAKVETGFLKLFVDWCEQLPIASQDMLSKDTPVPSLGGCGRLIISVIWWIL